MVGMTIDIILFAITRISTDIPTLAVVIVISPIGIYKLRKSGWLERKENERVESAKSKLEKSRKKLAEVGVDFAIKKYEKNMKGTLEFGTYGLLGAISLLFSAGPNHLAYTLIGLGVSAILSTIFIKTKYFKIMLEKMTASGKRDVVEGYLYNHFLT